MSTSRETRLELGLPLTHEPEDHVKGIPLAWFRRRKSTLMACALFLVLGWCFWLPALQSRSAVPVRDKSIDRLLRKIPGAIPGVPAPIQKDVVDYGRHGESYPSHQDLLIVLMQDLQDPSFRVDNSTWTEWRHWVSSSGGLPNDAHVQFLRRLKALAHGDLSDAQLYLEHPDQWKTKHVQDAPMTVFSKSYCPYSRGAKELLTKYHARFTAYEVDLRPDTNMLQGLLWDLTGHRTYPKVLRRSELLVRIDWMRHLHVTGWL